MGKAEEVRVIRSLLPSDAGRLSAAFAKQGWEKPVAQFERYLKAQERGDIRVFVAQMEDEPVGYVCLLPSAPAGPFLGSAIPCISDFNVLIAYQRRGIGSRLMDAAERAAFETSPFVCLGVGLHRGYGSAQRLYVKRGYVPDGSGVWYRDEPLPEMADCHNDDDLVLYLIKQRT